jgi:hypothetical protein
MNNIKYVGMDIHKAITVIVVLNALGQIESHSKVKTKAETLAHLLRIGAVKAVYKGNDERQQLKELCRA